MNLLISLRSEMLKTKRTASWYFTLLSAVLIAFLFVLGKAYDDPVKDHLTMVFTNGLQGLNLVIIPIFIILVCTMLPQIEYRNNAWKQVLSSPQKMWKIYLSKFLNVQMFIASFIGIFYLAMILFAVIINAADPSLGLFKSQPDWFKITQDFGNTYLAAMAIGVSQFIIGLRFRNFVAPIGIGFALWLSGLFILFEFDKAISKFIPYTYPTMWTFQKQFEVTPGTVNLYSFGYAVLFFCLGYWWFTRRKGKSYQ